jgi:hypothetical protein
MAHTGKATASVNGTVVAETASWEEVDGNVYFPPGALREGFWTQTEHTTHCPWKGDARYYTITVDGEFVLRESVPGWMAWLRGGDGNKAWWEVIFSASGGVNARRCRHGSRERGVVLSRDQGGGEQHQGPCCVL